MRLLWKHASSMMPNMNNIHGVSSRQRARNSFHEECCACGKQWLFRLLAVISFRTMSNVNSDLLVVFCQSVGHRNPSNIWNRTVLVDFHVFCYSGMYPKKIIISFSMETPSFFGIKIERLGK